MLRECPVACGVCTPECRDTNGGHQPGPGVNQTMCEMWRDQGACDRNPDVVLKSCPVACGVCKPKCKDLDADCAEWASKGECSNNTNFMMKNCPFSCSVCSVDGADSSASDDDTDAAGDGGVRDICHDDRARMCKTWVANGECDSNPEFMLRQCAKSCNLCKHVCQDHDASCSAWAQAEKGCEDNKAFMHRNCPASCGVCQALEASGPPKDEL